MVVWPHCEIKFSGGDGLSCGKVVAARRVYMSSLLPQPTLNPQFHLEVKEPEKETTTVGAITKNYRLSVAL